MYLKYIFSPKYNTFECYWTFLQFSQKTLMKIWRLDVVRNEGFSAFSSCADWMAMSLMTDEWQRIRFSLFSCCFQPFFLYFTFVQRVRVKDRGIEQWEKWEGVAEKWKNERTIRRGVRKCRIHYVPGCEGVVCNFSLMSFLYSAKTSFAIDSWKKSWFFLLKK